MQDTLALLDPLERSNGNGSRNAGDDWADEVSIFDNEWGSQAATTFNPSDTLPHKREKYRNLYKIQNGKGETTRKTTIRQSYIHNDADTFMCILEMPLYQRERVATIVDELDLSKFGGKRYEKIILTICSLVSDEALTQEINPSIDDRLFQTDEFRELMEMNKMSSSEHRQLRVRVREESEHFR